jgi:hypothetical protein
VLGALRGVFKPEFLNRIDDIVVFRPLGRAQIDRIVDLQLGRLRKLLADKKLTLELSEPARHALGDAGYDPVFGARPLKRAVQRLVQNPLALAVLEGRFKEGDVIVGEVARAAGSRSAVRGRTLTGRNGVGTRSGAAFPVDSGMHSLIAGVAVRLRPPLRRRCERPAVVGVLVACGAAAGCSGADAPVAPVPPPPRPAAAGREVPRPFVVGQAITNSGSGSSTRRVMRRS